MNARPERIRRIHLVLTDRCNLCCSYCYQDRKGTKRIAWETLRAGLDLGLMSERRAIGFTFYGGEPLLEFPLIRRAVRYVEARLPAGRTAEFSVITNGTLLTDDAARYLARHRFRLRLSIDGIRSVQDLRGRGTFERLDRLLGHLRKSHPRWFHERVTATAVLVPETVRDLSDSMAYLIAQGLSGIAVTPSITPGPSWRKDSIAALDEQCERVFELSLDHWRRSREIPIMFLRPLSPSGWHGYRRGPVSLCGASRGETLTVDVGGEVLGCGLLSTSFQTFPPRIVEERIEPVRIGRVDDPGLRRRLAAFPAAARRSGLFEHKEAKRSTYGCCAKCRYLARCFICPVSVAKKQDNEDLAWIPDFACAFNQVTLRWQDLFAERIQRETLTVRRPLTAGALRVRRLARALRAETGSRPASGGG